MLNYIIRRILYAIPILIGVNFITFFLFFVINSPDDMARMHLGQKHITPEAIANWKAEKGYDLPAFWNQQQSGLNKISNTLLFEQSTKLFMFDFGYSDSGRSIKDDIKTRAIPSLAIAIPSLILGLILNIIFAMTMVFFRNTKFDLITVAITVVLMSISGLFYIIGGQYLFAKVMHLVPVSGYVPSINGMIFLILPVFIAVVSGLGSGARWYRTLFLEEMGKDYVRTARAKGLSETKVLLNHVLRNALIPILTGVVVVLPTLFMGSLLLESFFGIPGLGSYTIDAIQAQDFNIVRAMVFLGAVLYVLGLLLTDISYTLVDPRVKLS